jgi:DNA primase
MADFQLIKERVSIEAAAQALGLRVTKSGASLRGECPACGTGGSRALALTPSKELFYCFSAGAGGDVISLWGHIKKCSLAQAGDQLAATFSIGNSGTVNRAPVNSAQSTTPHAPPAPPQHGFKALDYLEPEHDAVVAAGLDADTCRFIGAGYAPKGVLRGTVAIPIRDESGTLLGYVGVTEVLLPPKGLVPQTNVVALKRA